MTLSRARLLVAMLLFPLLAIGLGPTGSATAGVPRPHWVDLETGSTPEFRGLSPLSSQVAWVSGQSGTVLRTVDGGQHWADVSPGQDTDQLDFRDIEAFDADRAVIMSVGDHPGDFRIYRTDDGGRTWTLGFTNTNAKAFYDCMDFWDARHGIAVSDPVHGRFRIITTDDGGLSWTVADRSGMPRAQHGEFGFAASGTCLVTAGRHDAWLASGGGAHSRVYRSTDGGLTWAVTRTPIASSDAGGIFSLAVHGRRHLVAVGGDYTHPHQASRTSAYSRDGGARWTLGADLGGYRSGVAYRPDGRTLVAVGTTGSDISYDGGRTWDTHHSGSLDSVQCTSDGTCWASGAKGRVAQLRGW